MSGSNTVIAVQSTYNAASAHANDDEIIKKQRMDIILVLWKRRDLSYNLHLVEV